MEVRNTPNVKTLGSVSCGHPLHGVEDTEKGFGEAELSHPLLFLFCFQVNGAKGSQPPPLGSLHRRNRII